MAFVKLDCGILDSTLWIDRPSRDIFVTALLMAQPHELRESAKQIQVRDLKETGFEVPAGWYGFVPAAGIGIINRAGMEQEEGLKALERLGNPDPESRSPDFEGRRLIRIDGGYLILNFTKYREKDATSAERSKRWRLRNKQKQHETRVTDTSTPVIRHQAEAEAEAKEKKRQKEYTAEALELTQELISLMRRNDPKARIPDSLDSWHSSAELLLGKDGRELNECVSVLRGALNDNFWRANILSMPKFREKFTGLRAKFLPPSISNPITKATGAFA